MGLKRPKRPVDRIKEACSLDKGAKRPVDKIKEAKIGRKPYRWDRRGQSPVDGI